MTSAFLLAGREAPRSGFPRWTRVAIGCDYILIAGFHAWYLAYGIASVITTLLLYVTLGLVAKGLARAAPPLRSRAGSLALGVATVVIGLFLIELVLRYGVAAHQSYLERQGSSFYYSLYGGHKRANYSKRILGFADLHLHVRQPSSSTVSAGNEFSFASSHNSLGLREREVPVEKEADELRIAALGDSYTYGVGAGQDATWPRHLERNLRQVLRNRKVSVINGGIAGSDPFFGYVLLERRLIQYRPDIVVVTLNTSDIFDVVLRGGMDRFRADNTLHFRDGPWWEPLYATSYIVRHVVHDFLGLNWRLMSPRETENERVGALVEIGSCMERFVNLAARHDSALLVVVHPMSHQLSGAHENFDQLLETARSIPNLQVLDLRDYFQRQTDLADNPETYYWSTDRHHNEEGYRLFAEGIMKTLVSTELILTD